MERAESWYSLKTSSPISRQNPRGDQEEKPMDGFVAAARVPRGGTRAGGVVIEEDAGCTDGHLTYWIFLMAAFSFSTTGLGNCAYDSASVYFWPSPIIQFRKATMSLRLAASAIFEGTSSQVKLEIG